MPKVVVQTIERLTMNAAAAAKTGRQRAASHNNGAENAADKGRGATTTAQTTRPRVRRLPKAPSAGKWQIRSPAPARQPPNRLRPVRSRADGRARPMQARSGAGQPRGFQGR